MLPSLNLPVAVNFTEVPLTICALPGFTMMEVNFTVDTVNVVEPLIEPEVAEIVAVPAATLVATP